jgi:hypothetical protein
MLSKIFLSALTCAQEIYPGMNDAWYQALIYLRDNSPQESIINANWDRGDMFKYFADRRVVFDGHTQKRPINYWMCKVFLASDENEAVRILRMLNNASDTTYDRLNKTISDPFKCEVFLETLLAVDAEEAKELMAAAGIPETDRAEVIHDLYNTPDPAYLIVDESMSSLMRAVTFAGNWDFAKVYAYQNSNRPKAEVIAEMTDIFSLDAKGAQVIYDEIDIARANIKSPEVFSDLYAVIGQPQKGRKIDGVFYFDNGIIYSPKYNEVLIYQDGSPDYKKVKNVFITEDNKLKRYVHTDGKSIKGVWIFKKDNDYYAVIMKDKLMDSLFVRLLYLNGRGLKHFLPFYKDEEAGIYIYEIDWRNING